MYKTTVKVNGMMCGMCEAHVADAIRNQFPKAKSVKASHVKNMASFVTEDKVDGDLIKKTIEDTGYHYKGYETEEIEKKKGGLFGGLFKKK